MFAAYLLAFCRMVMGMVFAWSFMGKVRDVRAFEETWQTKERFGTSMRVAAYGLAVQRVAEATTIRGLYP